MLWHGTNRRIFGVTYASFAMFAAFAVGAAHAEPRPAAVDDVLGTWELVSLSVETGGSVVEPYGAKPEGLLIQSPTHTLLTIVSEDRAAPPGGPLSDSDAGRMMRTMGHWGATYEVGPSPEADGTKFTYHLTIAVNQALVGTDRVFYDMIDGDTLYVTSRSQPNLQNGQVSVTRVVWRRPH